MKIFRRKSLLTNTLTRRFFLPLILLITLASFLLLGTFKLSLPVEAEGEIEIYTLQDLDAVRNDLTASYILMNDLDFNDDSSYDQTDPDWSTKKTAWTTASGWTPIGTNYSASFEGTFDGQGYSISNLFINRTGYPAGYYVALFGYSKGTISNLNLLSPNVTGSYHVGGIVGNISHGGIINCSVSGSGTFTGTKYIGALIGNFSSSEISNSYYNYDTITVNGSQPFGLGALEGTIFSDWINNNKTFDFSSYFSTDDDYYIIDTVEKFKLIKNFGTTSSLKFKLTTNLDLSLDPGFYIPYFNSEFDGQGYEISNLELNMSSSSNLGLFGTLMPSAYIKNLGVTNAYVNGDAVVGLLAGYNGGEIFNSFSTGEIVGARDIGGLVGENYGTVELCYSNSIVTENDWNVGGLVGANSSIIKDSYFLGTITTGYGGDIGGLVGDNFGGTILNSYYNIDQVTIDGSHLLTMGALYNAEFTEWLNNGRYLNPDEHLTSEDGYYQINSLQDFKKLLAFGQVPNLKFELNTDIDLISEPNFYIPYLAGEFEGNGHTISNLSYMSTSDKVSQVGLFGLLSETGLVRNIGTLNVTIDAGYQLGGLVGESRGTIENSYSTGTVSVNSWGEDTGGLVGRNYSGTISNSYSTATISGNYYAGGLVGYNTTSIENSYASGSVSGYYFVGGLAGGSGGTITNSYSTGSITDLAGDDYCIGGLVGYAGGTATTANSFWDTETSGQSSSSGGTGKNTIEMKSISTYTSLDDPWDVINSSSFNPSQASTWYLEENNYPSLAMEFTGPEVETQPATNITKTSVTIPGELTNLASEPTVDVYFRYRTGSSDWTTTTPLTKTTPEGYTADLTNLTPDTTYEYSTVVTWREVGTDYGETMYFTTIPDLILPTGSIRINEDKTYTVSRDVNLSLSATDDLTGISQMMICNNSSFTDCAWENYSSTKQWTLTSGEGTKTVYVKFKDGANNISSVYSDSIILHTPTVRITDIGLISNVLDKDSLKYYFTSTRPVIKGVTQANSTVTFEHNDETYSTQADGDGNFNITLEVSRGSNEIEYYSSDTSGNVSTTKELTLIVGTENFPDWLLERLGLIFNEEEEETPEEEPPVQEEEPTQEEVEEEQEEIETTPITNSKKIKFTDKRGEPLAQATIEIEGNTYVTDANGEIEIKNLENKRYTAKVKTKDGKEYSMDILGVGDENGNIVVEVEDDRNLDWFKILIYTSVGIVTIALLGMLINSKKNK